MKTRRWLLRSGGFAATATLAGFAAADARRSIAGASPRTALRIMAPAAPAGGWDQASREVQRVLRAESIVNNVRVFNVPGAGGTIGLSQFARLAADPTQLMMTGTVMEGAITVNRSAISLLDLTPIARLAEDYEVFIVPSDSTYADLQAFLAAWTDDPRGIAIGGGGLGGTDHLLAGMVAKKSGIAPTEMNYISYAGGGEVLTALLSRTVALGVSSFNDFSDQIEAGNLRALALSADAPVPGIDVPTFIEQGTDVSLPNWRGLVAPAGITDAERDELVAIIDEMAVSPAWQEVLARQNWVPVPLAATAFAEFIEQDQARIDGIIAELGLI